MNEKTFSKIEIVVVANGYKLREANVGHPEYVVSDGYGEYVFENLNTLFEFVREHLLVPIEKRNDE